MNGQDHRPGGNTMKTEIRLWPHDLTETMRRRIARRRALNCLALGGKLGLLVLFGRALGALAVQDGAVSPWLILPTVIVLLWGAWAVVYAAR
jgi:hypothetical protein